MRNCVFSIIMPCYNSENYVVNAIESIVKQTYPEWELIIINDGSCDDTLKIVMNFAEKDERIKVFSKENGGYASAVNMGLDKISGDYFLFLGSDDYLAIDLLERIYEHIKDVNTFPDMIAFRTRVVNSGIVGDIDKYTRFKSVRFSNCKLKEFIKRSPQYSAIFSCRDTSKCYKRELLGQLRYFGKTGIDADGIFSMLMSHRANSFLNVPVDGYYWNIRHDSVSANISLEKRIDIITNWKRFFVEELIENYEEEITETEKKYLRVWSRRITELASTTKSAIKYRRFIKENALLCRMVAKRLQVKMPFFFNIVSRTPILFSLYCLLRKK